MSPARVKAAPEPKPAPLLCCRCGETIKAYHNHMVGDGWAYHSKCCDKPPAPCETPK